jgi:hypothetical protein
MLNLFLFRMDNVIDLCSDNIYIKTILPIFGKTSIAPQMRAMLSLGYFKN